MDLLEQTLSTGQGASSPLISLINFLAVSYLSEYFCVCVVKPSEEFVLVDVEIPTMIITVDERFNRTLLQGIEHGCQAFIVFQEVTLWPFLDSFLDVHDDSDQRSPRKKLIAVLDSPDSEMFDKFCAHPAVRDLPDLLMIVTSTENDTMLFYTTDISGDGTRGTVRVTMLPVTPPDYFPDKTKNMKGVPIRFQTLMYPPFTYYAETVST